jgi:xanthine dehydrogenase FAD-binding subunit
MTENNIDRVYHPKNLEEALAIRSSNRVIPFAGGTDLMAKRRRWPGTPRFEKPVLFIAHLDALKQITLNNAGIPDGKQLQLGAACTLAALMTDERVPPALKGPIRGIGGPAIKNVATIGGNVCNASPAGDTLPALYALDASVVLAAEQGRRVLPIEEFITGPGKTTLEDNELLVSILVPVLSFDTILYRKVGTRRANALSKLSFIGLARMKESRIADIRMAFGAVAPTVVRSREFEGRLVGLTGNELFGLAAQIRKDYAGLLHPIDDQRSTARYRKETALRLMDYFLTEAVM